MKELKSKIIEALVSALPITAIVYLLSLTPWFNFSGAELITFTAGAVMLVLGIGLFNMGADLAMTPVGTHVGSGLSRQKNLPLLLGACFGLALLLVVRGNEALLPVAYDSGGVTTGPITVPFIMALGVGISAVLGDRRSKDNSFGLVALCSVGPILAVLAWSSTKMKPNNRKKLPNSAKGLLFAAPLCYI